MFESISARKAVEIAVKTEEPGAEVHRRLAHKSDGQESHQLFSTLGEKALARPLRPLTTSW